MLKEPSILKWENTAHITKMSIEGLVALASLAGAITAILIATKVIAGPAGIAVLFIAAIYFAAAAYSSYQQMYKNEEIEVNGANFATLVKDVVKSGTIVEENQQLSLEFSKSDYEALTNGKNVGDEVTLNVLLEGKSVEVKFKHVAAANDNGNYKVTLTSPTDKKALDMVDNSNSSEVAVSNENFEALKDKVPTNLVI